MNLSSAAPISACAVFVGSVVALYLSDPLSWELFAFVSAIASGSLLFWNAQSRRIKLKRQQHELKAAREIIDRMTQEHWVFVSEANRAFSERLEFQETLSAVTQLAIPHLADAALIGFYCEVKEQEVLELAGFSESLKSEINRVRDQLGRQVVEFSKTLNGITRDDRFSTIPELARLRDQLKATSSLVVPLRFGGKTLGSLILFISRPGQRYTDFEAQVAEMFASRASTAIHNSELYHRQQKMAEERARILSVVSHELKNPLTAMMLQTEILEKGDLTRFGEVGARSLETINLSIDRMQHLVEDLLEFGKIDAGRLRLNIEEIGLRQLIDEILDPLRPILERNRLAFEVESSGEVTLRVDRRRVGQVFNNLIGNAVKFTPPGGRVSVHATTQEESVQFAISDTGRGIPAEERIRIFDPFWQGRRAKQGTGLGLAISKGIVETHGGRLWLDESSEKGATFRFILPLN